MISYLFNICRQSKLFLNILKSWDLKALIGPAIMSSRGKHHSSADLCADVSSRITFWFRATNIITLHQTFTM